MQWIQWLGLKARALFRRGALERELDAEIEFHIDMETEKYIRAGRSPAEARRLALVAFGGVDRHKEATRSSRGLGWLDTLTQDLRYAGRAARRNPGHWAVVTVTIALGIGGATAVFTVVDGVLLRPLPFPDPDRLVRIWGSNVETGDRFLDLTYQDFEALRGDLSSVEVMGAYSGAARDLTDPAARPQNVEVARVSEGFFETLGTGLLMGRPFSGSEYAEGTSVTVISEGLWAGRYGSDPAMLGRRITLEGEPLTVVGIVSGEHTFPANADLWHPLSPAAREDDDREFLVVARLEAGVSIEQVTAAVQAVAARRRVEVAQANENVGAWVQPLHAMLVHDVRTALLVLMSAVGLVLLIACANVANLLLARGSTRASEMAVRTALGAGRRRIVRQLLTESVSMAGLGGALGVVAGGWALRAVLALLPSDLPQLGSISLDGRVLAVASSTTIACGLLFGLVPAVLVSRADLRSSLAGAARAGASRAPRRLQSALVVGELALSTVVIMVAALLGTSFVRLTSVDRGFDTDDLLIVPVQPFHDMERAEVAAYFADVRQRLGALPGVESIGLGLRSPLYARGINLRLFGLEGLPDAAAGAPAAGVQMVEPEYFTTLGVPVVEGQPLPDRSEARSIEPAVVNEAFASAFFRTRGLEAVGHRYRRPAWSAGATIGGEIVGVMQDVTADLGQPVQPQIFFPFDRNPTHAMTAVIRFSSDPAGMVERVRSTLWDLDPALALDRVATADQELHTMVAVERFNTLLLSIFAILSLILAAVGIYGVMAYQVAQRSEEIGLRLALGAPPERVVRHVILRGLGLAAAGVAAGLVAALAGGRLAESLLFGVSYAHPPTLLVVVATLMGVTIVACLRPAMRALRADPMTALRTE